jgi:hypothetical protein
MPDTEPFLVSSSFFLVCFTLKLWTLLHLYSLDGTDWNTEVRPIFTYVKTPYCRGNGRNKDITQTADHNHLLLHAG